METYPFTNHYDFASEQEALDAVRAAHPDVQRRVVKVVTVTTVTIDEEGA